MSEQYIFAIDNGTQSVRAIIFDTKGNLIGKGKEELEAYFSEQPLLLLPSPLSVERW